MIERLQCRGMLMLGVILILGGLGVRSTAAEKKAGRTIVDALSADARFSRFVAALKEAGLLQSLKGRGHLTVFAPTNDALQAIPRQNWDALKANREDFRNVLVFHIVEGRFTTALLIHSKGTELKTRQGDDIAVKVDGKNLLLWDGMHTANVLGQEISTENGIIHAIDTVVLPPAPRM